MADETENKSAPSDDVKQSFAWGQLFAGSLIGGLAVWKLLHKMTNTEPSEWFLGLSRAYEEVRDFVMTPFQWLELHPTEHQKDGIVAAVVLVSALAKAAMQFPTFGVFVAAVSIFAFAMGLTNLTVPEALQMALIFAGFSVALLIVYGFAMIGHDPAIRIIVLNVLFTALCGTALLLLNWATSEPFQPAENPFSSF